MPSRPRILLVEDDHDVHSILSDLLGYEGFEVVEARNGQEALAALRKLGASVALILLDLMMPVMDGRTFIERLRADASLPKPPVVVLTASHWPEIPADIPVLSKPLDLERVMSA